VTNCRDLRGIGKAFMKLTLVIIVLNTTNLTYAETVSYVVSMYRAQHMLYINH